MWTKPCPAFKWKLASVRLERPSLAIFRGRRLEHVRDMFQCAGAERIYDPPIFDPISLPDKTSRHPHDDSVLL